MRLLLSRHPKRVEATVQPPWFPARDLAAGAGRRRGLKNTPLGSLTSRTALSWARPRIRAQQIAIRLVSIYATAILPISACRLGTHVRHVKWVARFPLSLQQLTTHACLAQSSGVKSSFVQPAVNFTLCPAFSHVFSQAYGHGRAPFAIPRMHRPHA
jgi:hypothetical protein